MSETVNGNHKLVEFPPMSKARTNWLSSCIGVASYVVSVGGSLELGKNAVITDCTQKPDQDLHEQKYKMVHDLCHSALGVMGSKVYAFGLCSNGTYRCQRFSLESEDCESVDVAFDENPPLTKLKGLVINEKLYIYRLGMSALVFDPLQGKIEIEKSLEEHLSEDSCVIGNKIYSLSSVDGCIHVYDGHYWRRLLKNVEVGYSSHVQLVNLRGNLLILYKSGKEVWGKEISIENEGAEVWCEMVMKMDRALFVIDHIVSVTL
ncbi:unnamed protein product [Arabis nemorensis]|uniref:F-box associated domain-containing protein n=1 Tax=Arabis nemorensis TaxID=586526 RepID=A0A565C7Y7_9BRAS|nr:unnamed protein product [Arabis nemorensis]